MFSDLQTTGKLLVFAGLILITAGTFLIFEGRIPWLGQLPGDLRITGEKYAFYFPVVTCILVSIILSLIIWILRKN